MSKLELIRHLYGYNEWANSKLLDAASRVPAEQLLDARVASWGSLITDLAHIGGAQAVWLSRWQIGRNPTSVIGVQGMTTLDEVHALFDESHAGLREYVSIITEDAVESELDYSDSRGNQNRRPLWQLMTHVANHGTYHRGEIAGALTSLGSSPGDLDFVLWELGIR